MGISFSRVDLRRVRRLSSGPCPARGDSRRKLHAAARCQWIDVPIEFDALTTDPRIKDVEVKPGVPFEMGRRSPAEDHGADSGGVVVFRRDRTTWWAYVPASCASTRHESCGQCTPCREGTGWLARVCTRLAEGEGRPGDINLLADVANGIAGNSICALGDACAWPNAGVPHQVSAPTSGTGLPKGAPSHHEI